MSRSSFYSNLDLVKGNHGNGIERVEEVSREAKQRSIQAAVGRRLKGFIDEEFMDQLEVISGSGDEVIDEYMCSNFIEWLGVLDSGKWGLKEYIDAVKYCSYRLLGETQESSYRKCFQEKCAKVEERYSGESESSRKERVCWLARAYDKNKLVCGIMRQSLVPSWILNAPLYQEALNELVKMVRNNEVKGMSKVRACEAILEATKQPEEVKVSIGGEVSMRSEAMDELRQVTEDLCRGLKEEMRVGRKDLREVSEIELVKNGDEEYV